MRNILLRAFAARPVIIRKWKQLEREDAAWSDGYHLGDEETDEALAYKDAFIAQQADLLQQLVKGDYIDWLHIPDELRARLADYV